MWLLDTNAWIRYLNPAPHALTQEFKRHPRQQIFLCDVVKAELYFGAFRSQRVEQNLALLEYVFSSFVSLPFDGQAAQIAGQMRAYLARRATPIGPYDVCIAAIALANDLTLVTHNTSEFRRVPGLSIEDWESN